MSRYLKPSVPYPPVCIILAVTLYFAISPTPRDAGKRSVLHPHPRYGMKARHVCKCVGTMNSTPDLSTSECAPNKGDWLDSGAEYLENRIPNTLTSSEVEREFNASLVLQTVVR